jgi:hypothetical protein
MMSRALLASLASLALAAVLAASAASAGGSGAISAAGRIGPLQIDKSTRADVVAFAGAPDAEVRERVFGFGQYIGLGYDCQENRSDSTFTLGNSGPYCRTAYFLDINTRKLEDFVTTSASFREARGVRIGTSLADAQRRLTVIRVDTATAKLRVNVGGRGVDTFALHSLLRTSGLFNCMA